MRWRLRFSSMFFLRRCWTRLAFPVPLWTELRRDQSAKRLVNIRFTPRNAKRFIQPLGVRANTIIRRMERNCSFEGVVGGGAPAWRRRLGTLSCLWDPHDGYPGRCRTWPIVRGQVFETVIASQRVARTRAR